jgi:hypothetical protein
MYIGGDVAYYNTLARKVQGELDAFIASSQSTLALTEPTGYPLWSLLAASLTLWIAANLWDPLVPSKYKGWISIATSVD